MNTLLCGLDFGEEGQAVLATQTEHNSVLRPLMNQSVKNAHSVWIVSCGKNGAVTEQALENRLEKAKKNNRQKAVCLNHKSLLQCNRIHAGYENGG